MRIFILSVNKNIYSTKRIAEEAEKRGHQVIVINHTKCTVKLGLHKPEIFLKGYNIIDFPDAIIPRIGTTVTKHGAAVVKQFEMNGIYSTARSLGILRSRNKVRTLQILNRKHIPIPPTVFAINPQNIDEQIALLGGPPVIIKLQEGTQGKGVILAETTKSAKSILDTFYKMDTSIMIQQFIEESNGEDIRAFVVGDKIVAAMKRIGADGDFRSNIHRGGKGEMVQLTQIEKKIALKATKYLGLPVAGVDMIRSKTGPLLIEVNSTPGLEGIEGTTKINIAEAIIKHLENNVLIKS
ncbi:MAG TPA: RimK family alpha-L-glutamate ligase [Saprospiraceae bacterium]|nr:RimK family alpha-L-glutamate ligase [Saprospiraceae bacterium]